MRKNQATNNFTGGEWTPFLDGRSDLQKYESACIAMQNFRPLPWGGATYRAGLEFIGLAKFPDRPCRLIPFNYSTALSYIFEMGDLYMRVWNANGTAVNVTATGPSAPIWAAVTAYTAGQFVTSNPNGLTTYLCVSNVGPTATRPENDLKTVGNPSGHWILQRQFEMITPYAYTELAALQFKQINGVVYLCHPNHPVQKIQFNSDTLWTIGEVAWKYPVLLDQNAVQAVKLNVAATTGSTTLISNTSGFFNVNMVGGYFELQHLRTAASQALDLNNQTIGVTVYSSTIQVEGDWDFNTTQFWWGVVQVQRSVDGGTTWTVVREFQAKSNDNFSTSGTETAPNIGLPAVLYRIAYTMAGHPFDAAVWVGTTPSQYAYAQASFECQDAYIAGLVHITAYIDSQNVTVTVLVSPVDTSTTYLWSEGAFSKYRGYPATIALFEQRVLYSSTAFQPNTVWGSTTGDFDNFLYSSNDDGAVAFQPAVAQQNPTAWLATLLRIHLGTSGEEIIMASGNFDEALTPSNVTMRAQSNYGSAPIQPILLQNSILFVERNGLRVREMREMSPYAVSTDFVAPDLTLMSEHLMQPGIVQMDFGKLPDPLVFTIRSDGVMPVMTYNREQNITAWARYVTQGNFESVACIYGSPADEVWVSCSRVLGGTTVRTVESFTTDPAEYPSITNNLMLDCASQTINGGAPISSVASLTWLKGVTVTAVIDGAEYAGLVVDNGGTLTFPDGVTCKTVVNIGLPYTGYLSPMKPELNDQEGVSQGKKRRVQQVVLRVRNSVSVEYAGGANPTTWTEMQFRSPGDTTGAMTPLSSTSQDGTANPNGISDWPLPGPWPDGNNFTGQVNLRQAHPFPLTVLAVFTKFDVLD